MYNFSSAISTNSFSSSPLLLAQNQSKNLEPTTFSLNDGSPIAFKRYPSDAMTASTSIPNLMQRSYSHAKLQRRNTSEVSRNSPIMTYKGSRSPSPINLSPSPNSISIRSGSVLITAAPQMAQNVQIYEALKEQKKKFFQRGQSLQLTTIFPQKIETQTAEQESPTSLNPAKVKPSTLANIPLNTEASETMLPEGKSFAGLSPRRRLAESPLKTYNVKPTRIKDQMKESMKSWNVLMRSKGKKGVFEIKTRSNSNIVKPVETKSAYMRELEKTLNEERKALDKLGEIGSQKFGAKLNLYNKYYDEYLDEPEQKYMGQADLKVEVKPIIEESALSIEARKFQAKKKIPAKALQTASTKIFAVKELIGVKDLNFTQASAQSSPPKRENSVRFRIGTATSSSPSRRVKVEQEDEPEEKPAAEENGEWKYFGKEMSKVQENIMGLQKITAYMSGGKTELTDQETKFFRMVKAGNTLDVQNMLKSNGELVKIRDSTNQTPLHWAVKRGLAEVLGVLLEAGADLDAVDMTGRKVLDVLPASNRKEILDMIDQKEWEMKRKAAQ